ncbi:hypothetical protein GCM10025794_00850 [Massilia kyonggiensis]|nr:hypothetical protein [Massilia kyonggiensis]
MRKLIFSVLILSSAAAGAETYRCPQAYPGKEMAALPLTSADMTQDTDIQFASGFFIDDEAAEEGYNAHYAFDAESQTRLVCIYGGKTRVKGRVHDGHEWNQRMQGGDTEWSMKLAPKISRCTLQVREIKVRDSGNSKWTATANCTPQP